MNNCEITYEIQLDITGKYLRLANGRNVVFTLSTSSLPSYITITYKI